MPVIPFLNISILDDCKREQEDPSGGGKKNFHLFFSCVSEMCPICHLKNKKFMLICDNCHIWYHGKCVGVPRGEIDNWICPKCSQVRVKKVKIIAD